MKERPQLSDEEIRSYMDFDRLLADRKQAIAKPKFQSWKWIVPAIAVIGLTTWVILDQREKMTSEELVANPEHVVFPNNSNAASTLPTETTPRSGEKVASTEQSEESSNDKVEPSRDRRTNTNSAVQQQAKESVRVEAPGDQIYIQAEPLEGYSALYAYFNSNLEYPQEAVKDSIQGIETVSFVINTEGKPEKITIKQSLGEPFEKEARRLIENMPLWKPATLDGKPVPSQMSVPLTFQIQKVKGNR